MPRPRELAYLAAELAGTERYHRGLAVQAVAAHDLDLSFDHQPGRRIAHADVVNEFAGRETPRLAAGEALGRLDLLRVEHRKHLVVAIRNRTHRRRLQQSGTTA